MNHRIISVRAYAAVFFALLALTLLTVAVSRFDLGEFNFIAAMTIAVMKGTLVAAFFMDLRRSSSLTKLFAAAGLFWLSILLVFLLSDYMSRGWSPLVHWP